MSSAADRARCAASEAILKSRSLPARHVAGRAASQLGYETGELTSVVRNVFDDHLVARASED